MKVLFTSRQFYPCVGGTETYMLECAKRLVQRGHSVTVLALNRNLYTGEKLNAGENYLGIQIVRFPFIKFPLRPIPIYSLFKVLKFIHQFDLIHTHDIRFLFETTLLAKLFFKIPLVVGSYGFILHQKKLIWLKQFVFQFYYKPLFRLASCIHTISSQDEEKIAEYRNQLPIERIVGGIDFERFSKKFAANKQYHFLETPKRPVQFLYFGRLDSHKGIDLLLPILESLNLDCELHLVFGSYHAEFKKLIESMETKLSAPIKIHWHGRLSNEQLDEKIRQADFVVLPSRYEGFGLTTVEAMATGAIVLGNDIIAFRNIITHGKNGFLIPYEDLTRSIKIFTDILSMSERSLHKVSLEAQSTAKLYDWDFRVDEFEALYKKHTPNDSKTLVGD